MTEKAASNIMVIGCGGMLGWEVVESLGTLGLGVEALDFPQVDITKQESIRSATGGRLDPALIINCAAYTAVDKAESDPDAAFAANRDGPANLADECARIGIPLIHISTDFVFNGKSDRPYREDDAADPISVYGVSKWQGEEAIRSLLPRHLIVRTSWLYGAKGQNFVKTMLKLGSERDELKVVCDQYGCPTWSFDLARSLTRLAELALTVPDDFSWGTYHYCGAGVTTWHQFASTILDEAGKKRGVRVANVLPIPTSGYPTAAARPAYSALDCGKIERVFGIIPQPWEKSLKRLIGQIC